MFWHVWVHYFLVSSCTGPERYDLFLRSFSCKSLVLSGKNSPGTARAWPKTLWLGEAGSSCFGAVLNPRRTQGSWFAH